LHRYEKAVLNVLRNGKELSLDAIISAVGFGRDGVLWSIENLSKDGFVEVVKESRTDVELSDEGKRYASTSLPEQKMLKVLEEKTVQVGSLSAGEQQIGLLWAKKKGLVRIEKGIVMLTDNGVKALGEGSVEEKVLKELSKNPERYASELKAHKEQVENLSKRKLIVVKGRNEIKGVRITEEGKKALKEVASEEEEQIDALTKAMIANKQWQGKKFKPYDVNLRVEREIGAKRNPMASLLGEIRRVYTSNGFREISGPIVESAFWTFDSLFMPQDHPARETQDAFYLSNPAFIDLKDKKYVDKVSRAHEKGWHDKWDIETARQAVLRTHTTSTTSRYIYQIIEDIVSTKARYLLPLKLFSVGRIFRNENIDYRHLADFYQMDGIIIGEGLTLANLFDTLAQIYASLGIEIKFKPSYFPFVEPGAEIYAYSKLKKEWIEMGGSGIIRKEITGVTKKNINVLAWGCGIERLTLINDSSISSISELYNNSLGWVRRRSVV
jgi:phenylalanyl-tRNA synthetase alpha chain